MEKIFKSLGYMISDKQEATYQKITVLYISNPDGTKRWVWPSDLSKPLFLKFYNISNFKGRMIALLIKIIFTFKLQRLVFKSEKMHYQVNSDDPILKIRSEWALFTGTVGSNNKAVLYTRSGKQSNFIKIATTETAKQLIQNERFVLNRLFYSNPETFKIPSPGTIVNNTLTLSDISAKGQRMNTLTNDHMNALIELNEISSFTTRLTDLESWNELKDDIESIEKSEDSRIPRGMIRKLKDLIDKKDRYSKIEVSICHGDFTPWNMFVDNEKLNIYDWELSQPFMPIGFDAFHFIMQQGILVDKKNWKQIKQDIEKYLPIEKFKAISKFGKSNVQEYLELYLIFNTVKHLKLYASQISWHEQVYWMLNVWNDAITSFIKELKTQRQLVIMDLFDFLLDKNYATIKFQGILPEMLSEFSDIDMFIEKPLHESIFNYLKNHPYVNHLSVKNSSFMSTLQVICNDGTIVSLDLIWQMKRKNLELLNVKEVLKGAYLNFCGIKVLELKENIRYIGLFYLANGANIPSKFRPYEELLRRSESPLDNLLFNYFTEDDSDKKPVYRYIKNQAQNQGLKFFQNTINYLVDVCRTAFFNKGMVITFSGVDGAGKSTVIERIKFKLEKQLRRRVVVLRHRPSLLPIISTFKKGKAQAELDATQSLPRMGNNNSKISSLLRFAYYYTDYLIGQFVIYFKYVSRGYVVLYDRYYYDFINDAKRSNISLPSSFTKMGLFLLMKPKLNFLLYLDADKVFERKKELSKETINALTKGYMDLFVSLKAANKKEVYKTIENVKLEDTLDDIFSSITKHAA